MKKLIERVADALYYAPTWVTYAIIVAGTVFFWYTMIKLFAA